MGIKACVRYVARSEKRNRLLKGGKVSTIPVLINPPDRTYAQEVLAKFRASKAPITILKGAGRINETSNIS